MGAKELMAKLAIQKEVKEGIAKLKAGVKDIKERLALQRAVKEGIAKLQGVSPDGGKTLYEQLIAGVFNKLGVVEFIGKLKGVLAEGIQFEALKEPTIKYIQSHFNDAAAVYESADGANATKDAEQAMMLFTRPKEDNSKPGAVRERINGFEQGMPKEIIIDVDTDFEEPDSFRPIVQAIEQAREVDTVTLKINSHGGRTDTAQAVYVALLECKAPTKAKIITAYSSGSIVAMGCDSIETTPHCTMMVHNASSGSWGKLGDMKTKTQFLEQHFKDWFDDLYRGFLTPSELEDVFKGQDLWFDEREIKKRLPSWVPQRRRMREEAEKGTAQPQPAPQPNNEDTSKENAKG